MTSGSILVAAPSFLAGFPTRVCDFLSERLSSGAMQMRALTNAPEVQDAGLRLILARGGLDALIAISIRPSARVRDEYRSAGIPIVLIDEATVGVSTVATNNELGGRLAGHYLVTSGRKRLAVVVGRMNVPGGYNARERLGGFREALAEHGLRLDPERIIEVTDYSVDDGMDAMEELAKSSADAVFCAAGDICASGLIRKARQLGVKIPADVAIVGYDDLPMAQIVSPNLTTIRQPLAELANAAYRMAVTEREVTLREARTIICEPTLIIRESA